MCLCVKCWNCVGIALDGALCMIGDRWLVGMCGR